MTPAVAFAAFALAVLFLIKGRPSKHPQSIHRNHHKGYFHE